MSYQQQIKSRCKTPRKKDLILFWAFKKIFLNVNTSELRETLTDDE